MAYNVSENYREIVYSGEALYNCKLKINNTLVPIEQISSIKISSPIIDTTSETGSMFHIGTFISQKLDIKFKNLDGLTLANNPEIELEIGLLVNNNYEYVPIGKYLIDELAENYQKTCEITCMDYAIKFNSNIDISQFFNQQDYIYASDLFERICGYYGVVVGTYPNINNNKKIYFYDNSLTGKKYIMYLAELFGGNAKIERDGSCSIIPLKNYTDIEINALTSKKFEIGDTYELSRVCYDNGKLKYQAPLNKNVISVDSLPTNNIDVNSYYYLTTEMKYYKYNGSTWQENNEIKNTLYLRTDNLFITQQEDIDNIYSAVENFSVTNIMCENRMDLSLDCWDIIKYTTEDNEYYTFYDNTITFNGIASGKVEVNIPLKTTEETTNIITTNNDAKFRRIQTTVDEQNLEIATVISNVNTQNNKISQISQTVDEINQKISDIADITVTAESNYAFVELNRINESEPILIRVHPISTNISKLYPRTNLYPSTDLFMPIRTIRFTRTYQEEEQTYTENIDYEIPDDLLYYDSENYDEFHLDYESQTCEIIKKCKYNADGTVGLLTTQIVETFDYPTITLGAGNYVVSILTYNIGYIKATLMSENIYTTQFYTKVQTDSQITQKADEIILGVNQTLTGYATTNSLNSNVTSLSSRITQNANSITSEVSRATSSENTLSSRISQTAKGISLTVNNGSTSSGIVIGITKEDGTTSQATGTIQMNGLVKFTDLKTSGSTEINGANITTGTISANRVDLSGYLTVSSASSTYASKTSLQQGTTTISGGCITTGTLSASKITTGTLDASKVSVTNLNASNITSGTISANKISGGSITASSINLGNGKFSVTTAGAITSTSGKIGGFTIDSSKIYNGKSTLTANSNGVYIGTDGISLGTGSTFKVTNSGVLTATNANISGTITATSGIIGGCSISNGTLIIDNANINSINGNKISDGSISGGKIGSGTIVGGNIANNTITSAKIQSISADKISAGTIHGCDLAGNYLNYNLVDVMDTLHIGSESVHYPSGNITINGYTGQDFDLIVQHEGQYWRKLIFHRGILVRVLSEW